MVARCSLWLCIGSSVPGMDNIYLIIYNRRKIYSTPASHGPHPEPVLHRSDSPSSRDFVFALGSQPKSCCFDIDFNSKMSVSVDLRYGYMRGRAHTGIGTGPRSTKVKQCPPARRLYYFQVCVAAGGAQPDTTPLPGISCLYPYAEERAMQDDDKAVGAGPGPGTWRGYAQVAAIVVVLAAAFYFARAPRVEPVLDDVALETAGAALPEVEVVQPRSTAQGLTIHLTGTVSLQEKTTIRSEVPGRIVWVSPSFDSGGFVAAEETLARIDPAVFELEVAQARAAVEGAEARVWLEEELGAENEREFGRANPDGEPSAWVRRLPHLALARAELKQAQAALGLAELQLARTDISLPYDVRVVSMSASVGEWVNPEHSDLSAQLGVVYQPGALQVKVPIEPGDLAYLEPAVGRAARLTGRMGAWAGEVTGVGAVVNPASRLATVFIEFADSESVDALPPPGTFVEVLLEGPAIADVFVLPPTVLQETDGIWVVREGRLHAFRPEEYGRIADGWVVKAFDVGEGVVVGTLPGAREGLAVSAQVAPATR